MPTIEIHQLLLCTLVVGHMPARNSLTRAFARDQVYRTKWEKFDLTYGRWCGGNVCHSSLSLHHWVLEPEGNTHKYCHWLSVLNGFRCQRAPITQADDRNWLVVAKSKRCLEWGPRVRGKRMHSAVGIIGLHSSHNEFSFHNLQKQTAKIENRCHATSKIPF